MQKDKFKHKDTKARRKNNELNINNISAFIKIVTRSGSPAIDADLPIGIRSFPIFSYL